MSAWKAFTAVVLLVTLLQPISCHVDWSEDEQDLKEIMRLLLKPRKPERYRSGVQQNSWKMQMPPQVNGFSWQNCGSSSDPGKVTALTLSPDPLHLPGNITLSFSGILSQSLNAPVEMSLEIKKKMLFWITLPCVDNLGSCDYPDICSLLEQIQCPGVFPQHGIPCRCPFKAGSYELPITTISLHPFGIPSWLESGDYSVEATIKSQGAQITCLKINFSLD